MQCLRLNGDAKPASAQLSGLPGLLAKRFQAESRQRPAAGSRGLQGRVPPGLCESSSAHCYVPRRHLRAIHAASTRCPPPHACAPTRAAGAGGINRKPCSWSAQGSETRIQHESSGVRPGRNARRMERLAAVTGTCGCPPTHPRTCLSTPPHFEQHTSARQPSASSLLRGHAQQPCLAHAAAAQQQHGCATAWP